LPAENPLKTPTPPEDCRPVFEFGPFRLDPAARELLRDGEPVRLTPRVFDTLTFLVEHRTRVLSKEELLASLWRGLIVEENNLWQAVSKLRHALGETPGENRYISTVPGYGYRFVAPVRFVEANDPPDQPSTSQPASASAKSLSWRRPGPWWVLAGVAVVAIVFALASPRLHTPTEQMDVPAASPRTLAVLPFKPLGENRDPALELGVADSLIIKLAAVGALSVRPLSAVRSFQDPSTDPVTAGRQLRVEAVLDGHVQWVEDRIRVSVRLLRVADGRQLWADAFDEELTGIFAVQEAISTRVVAALALHLDETTLHRLTRRSTASADAYEHYLRGRFHLSLAQPQQAIAMFEQAIDLDPAYAAAHAGLADILSRLPIATDVASHEPMERARTLARRALELDPELAGAHAALGWIGFYHDWDWPLSEAHFRRALALDATDFSARLGYAHLLSNTGRSAEALQQVDLALAADPQSPLAGTLKSQFLFHGGHLAEATEQLDAVMKAGPSFWIAHVMLGQLRLNEGRLADAVAAFDSAAQAGQTWMPRALAAYARARAGDEQLARAMLAPGAAPRDPPVPPYVLAIVHLGLENRAAALAALERGYDERDARMVFIAVAPVWNPLRNEPAFASLLGRMNLPTMGGIAGQ
jgi:DNA-binding winged helix-turn-helix (wHTH) protein/TolB-like protein